MDFSFSHTMLPHAGGCTVNHIPALLSVEQCLYFVLPVGHSKAIRWRWASSGPPDASAGLLRTGMCYFKHKFKGLVPPITPTVWLKHCIKPARQHLTLQLLIGVLEPPSRTHTQMAADIPSFTLNSGYKMPSVGMG